MGFDLEATDVHFVPGRFVIADLIERMRTEVETLGGVSLLTAVRALDLTLPRIVIG
jgi:hypothetical protein